MCTEYSVEIELIDDLNSKKCSHLGKQISNGGSLAAIELARKQLWMLVADYGFILKSMGAVHESQAALAFAHTQCFVCLLEWVVFLLIFSKHEANSEKDGNLCIKHITYWNVWDEGLQSFVGDLGVLLWRSIVGRTTRWIWISRVWLSTKYSILVSE